MWLDVRKYLMQNFIFCAVPSAKSVLIPLGVKAAATDAAIHKKIFGSGVTTLTISSEEMIDIMKIIKSLEESGLLIKDVSKTIKNKSEEQIGWFLSMLFGTLGASLLGNLLTGNGTIWAGESMLEQVIIFNGASSFNNLWNTKALSKQT